MRSRRLATPRWAGRRLPRFVPLAAQTKGVVRQPPGTAPGDHHGVGRHFAPQLDAAVHGGEQSLDVFPQNHQVDVAGFQALQRSLAELQMSPAGVDTASSNRTASSITGPTPPP